MIDAPKIIRFHLNRENIFKFAAMTAQYESEKSFALILNKIEPEAATRVLYNIDIENESFVEKLYLNSLPYCDLNELLKICLKRKYPNERVINKIIELGADNITGAVNPELYENNSALAERLLHLKPNDPLYLIDIQYQRDLRSIFLRHKTTEHKEANVIINERLEKFYELCKSSSYQDTFAVSLKEVQKKVDMREAVEYTTIAQNLEHAQLLIDHGASKLTVMKNIAKYAKKFETFKLWVEKFCIRDNFVLQELFCYCVQINAESYIDYISSLGNYVTNKAMRWAAYENLSSLLNKFVKENKPKDVDTLLFCAVVNNSLDCINLILKQKATELNRAMILSIAAGKKEAAMLLINAGADNFNGALKECWENQRYDLAIEIMSKIKDPLSVHKALKYAIATGLLEQEVHLALNGVGTPESIETLYSKLLSNQHKELFITFLKSNLVPSISVAETLIETSSVSDRILMVSNLSLEPTNQILRYIKEKYPNLLSLEKILLERISVLNLEAISQLKKKKTQRKKAKILVNPQIKETPTLTSEQTSTNQANLSQINSTNKEANVQQKENDQKTETTKFEFEAKKDEETKKTEENNETNQNNNNTTLKKGFTLPKESMFVITEDGIKLKSEVKKDQQQQNNKEVVEKSAVKKVLSWIAKNL